jgi:hypothetical protein
LDVCKEENNWSELECERSYSMLYDADARWMMRHFGFDDYRLVEKSTLHVAGLRIGVEVCLDHSLAVLANDTRGVKHAVDLQIITSAGMSIEMGPLKVPRFNPVFLVDGYGRTEVNRNWYDHGTVLQESILDLTDASHVAHTTKVSGSYDVGPVYRRRFFENFEESVWIRSEEELASRGQQGCSDSRRSPLLLTHDALGDGWFELMNGIFWTYAYEFSYILGGDARLSTGPSLRPQVDVYEPMSLRNHWWGTGDSRGDSP